MLIDARGFFNNKHRQWTLSDDNSVCLVCAQKDSNDSILELFLRMNISHKLKIENDNFTLLFQKYPGITFNLTHQRMVLAEKRRGGIQNENDLVEYFLSQRLTLGVGFYWPHGVPCEYTRKVFSIPILKEGKMWQIVMSKFLSLKEEEEVDVDVDVWNKFCPSSLKCLFCTDYPRDLYPGNFVINQSILHMKSFVWMDKRKLHKRKRSTNVSTATIMMYHGSQIIQWPFLSRYCFLTGAESSINFLGNMAVFSPGEVFTAFIDILIAKLIKIAHQNSIIKKLAAFYKHDEVNFASMGITLLDLVDMYKNCKRKKNYEVDVVNFSIRIKNKATNKSGKNWEEDERSEERLLIEMFQGEEEEERALKRLENNQITKRIIKWFHYPKSPISELNVVEDMTQTIKRGEIDVAISQTSVLNKDYATFGKNNNNEQTVKCGNGGGGGGETYPFMGTVNNLDVHRIGRFTRNASANSQYNICAVASSLQKVLPKDSKTQEPKLVTDSEVGFVDAIITSDAPKNCGLVLECVLDAVISTPSMTVHDVFPLLRENFPECQRVPNPSTLETLREDYLYICANQVVYTIPRNAVPATLRLAPARLAYIIKHYGSQNYFRMTQYALKIKVPFIELIEETRDRFWVCTSFNKNIYKLHVDGLFYSPREFLSFYHDPSTIRDLLLKNNNNKSEDDDELDEDFLAMWVGEKGKYIPNIFGPSVRLTPHPNACHLARVGHAAFTSKNFIGMATNSLSVGELHQKNLTVAYYAHKSHPSEIVLHPGWYPKVLVAGGFNNQEDGIVVRRGAIDGGKFSAVSYETATVKLGYRVAGTTLCNSNNTRNKNNSSNSSGNSAASSPITFIQTIKKGQILRPGIQVGLLKRNVNSDNLILTSLEVFSPEIQVVESTLEGNRREIVNGGIGNNNKDWNLAVIWVGRVGDMEVDDPAVDYFYQDSKNNNNKFRQSMAFQAQHPNYQPIRCYRVRFDNVVDAQHLKVYLTYSYEFTPSVGDKLQTTTANKGVIAEILPDQDVPYVRLPATGECIMPDIIINPQYLKRQTLDNLFVTGRRLKNEKTGTDKNPYMNNAFDFRLEDTIEYLQLGQKYATGNLINPLTGYPYLQPVVLESTTTTGPTKSYYDYPYVENLNKEDGFKYITPPSAFQPHALVTASIYTTRYFTVSNHRATHMMHSSHPDKVVRAEFSGAPVRGKRGGFATGPQEQMALVGMGMERFNSEISQMRSDLSKLTVQPVHGDEGGRGEEEKEEEEGEVLLASKTFRRICDELEQSGVDFVLKATKYNNDVLIKKDGG